MHNGIKIAYEFANAIGSEDIIRIILFGSVARHDDSEESDIDILIVASSREKINDIVEDEVFNINAKFLEVVSAHIMAEEFYNRTKYYSFLTSVHEEGVLLVEGY
ncbi:MAG: nucleotidyltransferase domain-containing protein [Methanobrevibacter sp.]|uniref:nucleotidyltransferase domain-containing protein n=1 Tax=Methanobrevibacter sp. TaxID=66852 RepID=UPI0025E83B16|nr:nucleotidyltransferase domain-containing protein [Methanobrevibacter sp.]MBR0270591.1 nucleotidyltransferase domain-containing protein [Methanobrevibacter sp.]